MRSAVHYAMVLTFLVISGTFLSGCGADDSPGSVTGTWRSTGFPGVDDSRELVFSADGSFSEVRAGDRRSASTGTYAFDGSVLALFYGVSTDDLLANTTQAHTGTSVSGSSLSFGGRSYGAVALASSGIQRAWRSGAFPLDGSVGMVFDAAGRFTRVRVGALGMVDLGGGTYSHADDVLALRHDISTTTDWSTTEAQTMAATLSGLTLVTDAGTMTAR